MKYLIPILVGAIIGYITNWLAIKMLFRPYTEKKFLGIRIPFTPGLIPKEMKRIAKSVGETIGEHLLSPEIVSEALSGENTGGYIKDWVENVIERLKTSPKSIKELLTGFVEQNYDDFSGLMEKRVAEFICSGLRNQKFRVYIKDRLKTILLDKRNDDFNIALKEKLSMLIHKMSISETTRTGLKDILENKLKQLGENTQSLNEVIPESLLDIVKSYIIEHDEDIVKVLRETLESPVIKRKIKALITEIVEQNTNRVITIFMSPESIAEKLLESVKKYIDNPANSKSIIMVVTTSMDKLLQSNVSSVFSGISPELKDKSITQISDSILGYITDEERQHSIIDLMEKKIKASDADIKSDVLEFISDSIDNALLSSKLTDMTALIVHDGLEWALCQPVSYILKNVDNVMTDALVDLLNDLFDGFVKNKLPYLVQLLDIPKIVEDRINAFDVVFAEEIIIDIANKELKAITWLGALLGGILGILTPLMQLFYQ